MVSKYTIYRKTPLTPYITLYEQKRDPYIEDITPKGRYHFIDRSAKAYLAYVYAVTDTDELGTESDKTTSNLFTSF